MCCDSIMSQKNRKLEGKHCEVSACHVHLCVCASCWTNHCFPFHAGNVLAGKQYSALSMDWGEPRRERKADKRWGNLTCKDKLIKLCLFWSSKQETKGRYKSLEQRQWTCSDETEDLAPTSCLFLWLYVSGVALKQVLKKI